MKIKSSFYKILLIIVIYAFSIPSYCEKKLDALLVYGDGFTFSVKEPTGWVGNCENASEFGGNVVFYKATESLEKYSCVVVVRVNSKKDENTASDLQYDMDNTKKGNPKIKFKDFTISHPMYKCYPKVFIMDKEFYEYVTYLNAEKDSKTIMFSFNLHVDKRDATKEELEAYKNILQSLLVFEKPLFGIKSSAVK